MKSNAALKQQVAQLGAEQLTLRADARMQMNAFMEAQQAENRKCMEQMTELHRVSVAATTATQAKLDALVRAVTDLPEGAQVLRNVFDPPRHVERAGERNLGDCVSWNIGAGSESGNGRPPAPGGRTALSRALERAGRGARTAYAIDDDPAAWHHGYCDALDHGLRSLCVDDAQRDG